MRRKTVSGITLLLLLIGLFSLAFNIQLAKSEPTTIIVPDDHEKIQWAVGNASDGDTIFVKAGTYYENLTIDRSISLIGEDRNITIVDGNLAGKVIRVSANNVRITGFTIRRGWMGIWYAASNDTVISDNTIMISRFGIVLIDSYGNTISGNIVEYSQAAGYGIDVSFGGGHTIYGNTIKGVRFWHSAGIVVSDSDDNIIDANKITNNIQGLWLGAGSNNTIIDNTLASNDEGIEISHADGNTIYHNNFVDNTVQAYTNGSIDVWDNGYPSGGNYWSDHVCSGNPSDGSQQYIINADNIDHYPFQDPNGWLLPPHPVGGKATPINIPMNKPETPALWIWLTTIILAVSISVAYIKYRKKQ